MTWNIRGNTGVSRARLARIVEILKRNSPHTLMLQEVPEGLLVDQLQSIGFDHVLAGPVRAGYGNVVASLAPVSPVDPGWFDGERPSSVTAATVHGFAGDFIVISAHVPNGSGNGWDKIETFEALASALNRLTLPTVLGGDFNEPRTVLDDGTVITFAMKQDEDGNWHQRGRFTARCGRKFPRARWARGVRSILGREPSVNLRHVLREKEGLTAWHTTHVVGGRERFFDHILASHAWKVERCGFDDDCRIDKTSDHSAVWADLEPS